ncbi:PTS trehalose transporter subunit IIC (plasmid) [Klebsiella aerogenes]|uniref:PTS transporter subunit EIIC n=1 Tax=Klebsiella aerogenes TaxID=548 RepID=UPI00124D6178|nr:PTS transporter subunit EIIC [Klebsiella aerogenes]QFI19803.1 PTS trehalose transporter subunit IIC [Klebsiella aerogenes]
MKTDNIKDGIQRFGRSLLLPIAVMAPIGMIMGICAALSQSYMVNKMPFLGYESVQIALNSLKDITGIVFNNIPLLFAMGVAYGMAKNEKGIAVFSSVLAYLTLTIVMNVWLKVNGQLAVSHMSEVGQGLVLGIQTLRIEAMGGIISGLVAARVTDRYFRLELPLAFAFFSGKKSVPIITFIYMIPVGLVIPYIWNGVTTFLTSISFIMMNDQFGVGIYWFLHRALIPFGLHHVLASVVRFTEAGGSYMIDGQVYTGIMNATNKILFELGPQDPNWSLMPKLTSYLAAGQMLNTLFRIPAIGLAMYHTSFKANRSVAKGILLTIVLTAFLGNVTEPLEFSFLFIAPGLFFVYTLLCGLMAIPLAWMDISIGYIRGTIFDFGIFGLLYDNTHWLQLLLLGAMNFIVFYVVFRFAIVKFSIQTPGREEEIRNNTLLKEKRYAEIATIVLKGLGGKENIKSVDNCVTRLRVDLKDQGKVDRETLKDAGSSGVFLPKNNHIHVVFGPHVEFVKNAVVDKMAGQ